LRAVAQFPGISDQMLSAYFIWAAFYRDADYPGNSGIISTKKPIKNRNEPLKLQASFNQSRAIF